MKSTRKYYLLVKLYQALSFVAFLVAWQLVVYFKILNPTLFPTPLEIAQTLPSIVVRHTVYTQAAIGMGIVFASYSLSLVVGTLLGLVLGSSSYLKQVTEPYLVLYNSIPKTAFLPAFFLAFGVGLTYNFWFGFAAAIAPITLNMMFGVMSVPYSYINAARSMGASRLRVYLNVIIPALMPTLLASARIIFGITFGVILISQMFVGSTGFGYLVANYSAVFAIVPLYDIITLTALVGIAVFLVLLRLEMYLTRWRRLT